MSGKSIGAIFYFIGAEPRVVNQEIDRAETDKKTKTFLVHTGSNPDAVQSTGCSPDHRPDGVRKVSGKSIGAIIFYFIGAEPRVVNQEIDRAETDKKNQNIPGSHRIEPGCSPIDRMQSGPSIGWSPEGVRKIDRCNFHFIGAEPRVVNQEIDRAETDKKKTKTFLVHTGSNPDAVQSTGCSPDHRLDGVRKVSGKSIGAIFYFIGAEPRVVNQEIDRAETDKKNQNIPGSHRIEPGCSPIDRMQSGPPTGWSPEGVRKIDRCNFLFHRGRTSSREPGNRSSRNR